jgi:PAS domain S-box-containing protein
MMFIQKIARNPASIILAILLLAGLYFATGLLGLQLAVPPGYATVFWPPAGMALALVYYYGYRLLPGVLVGSFLLNLHQGLQHLAGAQADIVTINAASIAVGASLQCLAGAMLLNRYVGRRTRMERLSQIVRLTIYAGPASCLIACSWGVATLLTTGTLSSHAALFSWATWYAGDTLGTLVFTPVIVLALNPQIERGRKIAVALPMMAMFAAVILFFVFIRQWDGRHQAETFNQNAALIGDSFDKQLGSFVEELESVKSLYLSSHSVERGEYKIFVDRALAANPGILGMSWIPRVEDADRESFESTVRNEGFPDFHIMEKSPSGLRAAAKRPEYFPLDYIESHDPSSVHAIGFDYGSEPVRLQTLIQARDSGQMIGSERIRFLNEKEDNQYGFLLALPFYQGAADTLEQRRLNLRGFLTGGYRFKTIVAPIIKSWLARGLQTSLIDVDDDRDVLLYSSATGNAESKVLAPGDIAFSHDKDMFLFGQHWRLRTYETQAYAESHINWAICVALAAGVLAIGLCGIFLLYISGRSVEVERVVQKRTSQLKRQRQFLELAMAATRDGLWDWDEERKSLWLSPRWKAMLGYDDNEIPNSLAGAESVISPQDLPLWRQRLADYMAGRTPDFLQIYRFFHRDGSMRYVLCRAMCERNEAGRVVRIVGAHTDITEIEQAKQELEKARDSANSANRAKGEFLANMSHEIRTPMNGVIGMTHLLLETGLDARQRHYAETIGYSADSLLQLINDILDFSKIEAGKLELEAIPFDIQHLCEEVAELMYVRMQEKGVEFLLAWDTHCPSHVIGDPGRLRQILFNLCGNAAKFTERGHVLLQISCTDITDDKASLRIAVHDSGIGIAADKQASIFNKFDQADTSTTRKYGGTGLGLAITRELVALMGGDIQLESVHGTGSTFHFSLSFPRATTQSPGKMEFDGTGLRALIADDHPLAASVLAQYLSEKGMDADIEHDPGKILERLIQAAAEEKPYVFALMDYPMPGGDILALATAIRARPELAGCYPVLTASQPGHNDTEAIRKAGVSGYLTKPVLPSQISAVLGALRQAPREGGADTFVTRFTVGQKAHKRAGGPQRPFYRNVAALLVEDNQTNQEVLIAMLERYGIEPVIANDGQEAVQHMKQQDYDIVLMDCQMPVMDGFEATRTIRREKGGQEVVIVALTANVMKGDREKCLEAGMNDYLSKPVDDRELEAAMVKWLPEEKRAADRPRENAVEPSAVSSEPSILDPATIDMLRQLAGAKFGSIVSTFRDNSRRLMANIDLAYEQKDADQLMRAAHSLKSSAGQLGAKKLQDIMGLIELHAGEGDLQNVEPLYADAKAVFPRMLEALEKLAG